MSPPRIRPSVLPSLALLAALAWPAPSRAEVVYALVVDPVLSPLSRSADVRVVLADRDVSGPFDLTVGLPVVGVPPAPPVVAVRVSRLVASFAEVELTDLAGLLRSRDGSTLDGVSLMGQHSGFFSLSLDSTQPAGTIHVGVLGPGTQVETIFGRFELASLADVAAPRSVVLLTLGLAGVVLARVLRRRRAGGLTREV